MLGAFEGEIDLGAGQDPLRREQGLSERELCLRFVVASAAGTRQSDAVARCGLDDLAVLDLAIAVADANQWARMWRLLELPPALFYVPTATAPPRRAG